MDPAIGWFQPEQCGPAFSLWNEIWNTHQQVENPDFSPSDAKCNEAHYINGNAQVSEDKQVPLKKTDTNNTPDSTYYNRAKRKENKASTYALSRNDDLIVSGGTPWRIDKKNYSIGLRGLHEEIEDFYDYMSPTPVEHQVRQEVVERITKIIHSVWPKSKVEVYGSFRTGLYLPTSDIDLVVMENSHISFTTLKEKLSDNNIAKEDTLKILDRASVPILKLTDAKTDIKIDISFNMSNGVKSANLVKDFMRAFPVLPKLVLVLKQFLLQRDLNEVFLGGISSYSLILLTISFLQHLKPQPENNNLGKLLIMFFELYGRQFNYRLTGISVKNGGSYFSKDNFLSSMTDGNRPSILCIEDPLLPSNDIGRSSYGAMNVKTAFEYAFKILSEAVRPSSDFVVHEHSILGRILRITDEVIEYRNWIHETFPLENFELGCQNSPIEIFTHCISTVNFDNKKILKKIHLLENVKKDSEVCSSSCSSDCQSSTHSSCVSLGSTSSSSSMASDTESDITNDIVLNKQELHSDVGVINTRKVESKLLCNQNMTNSTSSYDKKTNCIQMQPYVRSSTGANAFEKSKMIKSNLMNGSWVKQTKISPSMSLNISSGSTSRISSDGNPSLKSNFCGTNYTHKKKLLHRKDSTNVNISKKDTQVLIGRL